MRIARIAACLYPILTALAPLAACSGSSQLYPQSISAKAHRSPPQPRMVATFKARTIHSPARADLHDLAEADISREIEHPSSVNFQNEFQSFGRSIAICGQVTYRSKYNQVTAWRPCFVSQGA